MQKQGLRCGFFSFPVLFILAGAGVSVSDVAAQDFFNVFPLNGYLGGSNISVCRRTAFVTHFACGQAARSDALISQAGVNNLVDPDERNDGFASAASERNVAIGECDEQFLARLDLCQQLNEERYDPVVDPDDFVDPIVEQNPYFPLIPGTTFTYESDNGRERVEVTVTDETTEILDVICTVVLDRAFLDGELIEETRDYYAVDVDKNVWYFGEHSVELEEGRVVSLAGSWIAGEEGALPGILIEGDPEVGDIYRQEFLLTEAEDAAEVLSLSAMAEVPFGEFEECLMTQEFTPVEPDQLENKFYAPGVGLVLSIDVESGDRLELIEISAEAGVVASLRKSMR